MAAKVHCPYCGATFLYVESNAKSEVKCVSCGEDFVPVGAPPAEPDPEPDPDERRPARTRRSEEASDHNRGYGQRSSDWERRPRRRRPYHGNPIADKGTAPAIFLLVVAILQGLVHLMLGVGVVVMATDQRGEDKLTGALCLGVLFVVGICKDFIVIRGAIALKNGKGYGAAMAGAIAGCVPDVGWIIALIPSIWCLVVLNDPQVKQAFDRQQYSPYGDDDDF